MMSRRTCKRVPWERRRGLTQHSPRPAQGKAAADRKAIPRCRHWMQGDSAGLRPVRDRHGDCSRHSCQWQPLRSCAAVYAPRLSVILWSFWHLLASTTQQPAGPNGASLCPGGPISRLLARFMPPAASGRAPLLASRPQSTGARGVEGTRTRAWLRVLPLSV